MMGVIVSACERIIEHCNAVKQGAKSNT